jgi:hypothetical protein
MQHLTTLPTPAPVDQDLTNGQVRGAFRAGLAAAAAGTRTSAQLIADATAYAEQLGVAGPIDAARLAFLRGALAAAVDGEIVEPLDTAHRPWCVSHERYERGETCHAPREPAPTNPGQWPGAVVMSYDTIDGHEIDLGCKVDGLNLDEAERLGLAILVQVDRARRAARNTQS